MVVLDSEDHRLFLLEAVKNAAIPGSLIDLAYAVKTALLAADVVKTEGSD